MTSKDDTEARDMYYDAINVSGWGQNCRVARFLKAALGCCSEDHMQNYSLVHTHFHQALEKHIFKKTSTGLTYITDLRNGRPDGKMQHLVSAEFSMQ